MSCNRSLRDFFQSPDAPVISRAEYLSGVSQITAGITGGDISAIMPAAGQHALPEPQKLYDLASYWTPIRALWRRPRNVLQGP